jgi:hypothetical protein
MLSRAPPFPLPQAAAARDLTSHGGVLNGVARPPLQAYRSDQPALVAGLLDTLARYIHWIDIGLVANDK